MRQELSYYRMCPRARKRQRAEGQRAEEVAEGGAEEERGSTHTCFVSNKLLFFIRMKPNIRTRIRHDHTQLHLTFSEDFHWQDYPLHGNLRDIKLVHEIKFNINYSWIQYSMQACVQPSFFYSTSARGEF